MNLNGTARVWSQKGFVKDVIYNEKCPGSVTFTKGPVRVDVFQDRDRVTLVKGGTLAYVLNSIAPVDVPLVVARALSSVKPPENDFEHLFEAMAYPKNFGQCTIYPAHVIENGVIYQDAGGVKYIHREAPHISLMLFKGLYDRNRESELLLLNEVKLYEGQVFSGKIPFMTDDTVREALMSLYDIGSIDDTNRRSIPSRKVSGLLTQGKATFRFKEAVSESDLSYEIGGKDVLWSSMKQKYGLRDQIRNCNTIIFF